MTLLRMLAFRPALDDGTSSKGREAPVPSVPRTTVPRAAPSPSPAVSAVSAPTAPFGSAEAWAAVVTQLDQGAARQLAGNCAWAGFDDGTVRLRLDARSQQLRTRQIEEKLAQALSRLAGRDIRLSIEVAEASVETPARQQARVSDERLDAARAALEEDPLVRAVKERLGGVVVAESVKPVN